MAQKPRRPRPSRLRSGVTAIAVAAGLLASAAPASAGMYDGPPVDTRTWKGEGRTLHTGDAVKVAGKPFNRFLTRTLAALDGDDPACAGSGTVVLKKWRSDGYAWLPNVGSFAPCPGGGYYAVAVRTDGRWSIPRELGGQELLQCTDLSSYSVPPAIYRQDCFVPTGKAVAYRDWYWNKVDDRGNRR
ncbi:hypothetical protein KLP28_06030 [Nocardioidaceae bacterium]|nr:hypothetical protein KLP28_06030 [Nocardioidaceae bacterium]